MPYDLLTKAGSLTVLAILLLFLLKNYIDSQNKEQENYKQLVDDVRKESKDREVESRNREDKLMTQLDRYNDSLQSISENIKVIPQMQADITYLKEEVNRK